MASSKSAREEKKQTKLELILVQKEIQTNLSKDQRIKIENILNVIEVSGNNISFRHPTDSNNKILVNVNCGGCGSRNTSTYWRMRIKKDGSLLRGVASYIGGYGSGSGREDYPNFSFLDDNICLIC